MDNFLFNVRNGAFKRDRYRRNYGGNQNSGSYDKAAGNQKGNEVPVQNDAISDESMLLLSETLQMLKEFMITTTEYQIQILQATERRIKAEELKSDAMNSIANALQSLASQGRSEHPQISQIRSILSQRSGLGMAPSQGIRPENGERSTENGTTFPQLHAQIEVKKVSPYEREKIVETIKKLRNDRMSFKEIAESFESNGIPTFSGKGKWFASTVANILKSLNEKAKQIELV